jgi:hypothetical protein
MKVRPRSDYPVGVRPMSVEVPAGVAGLYEGIYEVTLNSVVGIVFCPSLADVAPPFRDELLPRDVDEITTATQARLVSILFSTYSVTPNDAPGRELHAVGRAGAYPGLPGLPGLIRCDDHPVISDSLIVEKELFDLHVEQFGETEGEWKARVELPRFERIDRLP